MMEYDLLYSRQLGFVLIRYAFLHYTHTHVLPIQITCNVSSGEKKYTYFCMENRVRRCQFFGCVCALIREIVVTRH